MIHLAYDKGTILVHGNVRVPGSVWDSRAGAYRASALLYKDIKAYVESSGFSSRDDVLDLIPCPQLTMKSVLRDYQDAMARSW